MKKLTAYAWRSSLSPAIVLAGVGGHRVSANTPLESASSAQPTTSNCLMDAMDGGMWPTATVFSFNAS